MIGVPMEASQGIMFGLRRTECIGMKIIFILLSGFFLTGCGHGPFFNSTDDYLSMTFTSNGERIYFTGTSDSGLPINATSTDSQMGMHMRMHAGGCVVCHDEDRSGSRLFPRFWIKAPALTAQSLVEKSEHDDGHGDHAIYTKESLRLAISAGLDPSQSKLHPAMPRWSMDESDMSDLVDFITSRDDS